ncbi:MAG: transposase [Desulfuromonadales bacterium]|nr:transposase [Desulfuromonadales bacterium]
MPRTARIVIPNYPHHIIQRGHNRQTIFASDDDYCYYLDNLAEWKELYGCKIYAFCLMTNHVHLVIDPGDNPDSLGKLMKRVAGRQTRYVNRLENRSGTLWGSRFKSSPIDSNSYLLACCRYVEMNPVVAGLCSDPAEYPWSSCCSKVAGIVTWSEQAPSLYPWLDFDPLYLDMGKTEKERQQHYHTFLTETVSEKEKEIIRLAVQRGQLTGGAAFIDEIEVKLNRRIEFRRQGRPKKHEALKPERETDQRSVPSKQERK